VFLVLPYVATLENKALAAAAARTHLAQQRTSEPLNAEGDMGDNIDAKMRGHRQAGSQNGVYGHC